MRRFILLTALLVFVSACGPYEAEEPPEPSVTVAGTYPERWILGYGKTIIEREGAEDFIALIKEAKRLGYTHIVYGEVYNQTMRAMPPPRKRGS
ncbi:MAG: hypothetical protein ACYTAN_13075 [Planctomycetota bacterium]